MSWMDTCGARSPAEICGDKIATICVRDVAHKSPHRDQHGRAWWSNKCAARTRKLNKARAKAAK